MEMNYSISNRKIQFEVEVENKQKKSVYKKGKY